MKIPNLPNLPVPKGRVSIGLVSLALLSGVVIGANGISHEVSVRNASADTDTSAVSDTTPDNAISDPVVLQTETSDSPAPAAPTREVSNPTSGNSPDSTSAPAPVQQSAAPAAQPAPVTITNEYKYTTPNGDRTMFYCHTDYSDGTSNDRFAGAGPTDQYNRGEVGFIC